MTTYGTRGTNDRSDQSVVPFVAQRIYLAIKLTDRYRFGIEYVHVNRLKGLASRSDIVQSRIRVSKSLFGQRKKNTHTFYAVQTGAEWEWNRLLEER